MHAETYGILIQELVADLQEQDRMFGALSTMPSVRAKADWCLRWIESENVDFGIRLVAFAIVEGVFFSSSFAAIFWIRSRGLLPGLCMSNELIARDEGMHTAFACLMTRHLKTTVPAAVVEEMMRDAVRLEQEFFRGQYRVREHAAFYLTLVSSGVAVSIAWHERGLDANIR